MAVLLVSVACLARPAAADAITLQPTDILQISFTTLAAPDCSLAGGLCDTLIFNLGFTNNLNGTSIATARLFDSSTLLGTFETSQACLNLGTCSPLVPSFVAPMSIYGLNSPVIDFTSILNGTIHGILDITLDKPIAFDPGSSFNFFFVTHATARGTGMGGYFRGYDSVTVLTSAPEPASIMLLGVGLASLAARRRRKKSEPR
jgi:PEP-CTERM motif